MQTVEKELKKMQEMDIIEPSRSEWASSVVLVSKHDSTVRFCVDYRCLNPVSRFDAYPMPRTDDIIDKLGKAKYISTCDLARGHWQIPMEETSKGKSAFVISSGLYQFQTMPFGLHGPLATFQKMMDNILQRTEDFCDARLDDIVIFSNSWYEHLSHLREILERLRQDGLTTNPKKCRFPMAYVNFLGNTVGGGTVEPQTSNILAVQQFSRPKSKTEVKSFQGLTGYYRNFIPEHATIATPLSDLTKKSIRTFFWSEDCEQAFTKLKQILCSLPVLHNPDFDKEFILRTDASLRGLGGVLTQMDDDGNKHQVVYLSRKLLPREQRYSAIEKECLEIVWDIESLRVYLYGRALQWLDRMQNSNNRLANWCLKLQQCRFKVTHRSGKDNLNADYLSRI